MGFWKYVLGTPRNYALTYDRRGKNKAISQLSDIEKLKAGNRLLKAQTQQQQMEIDFLKKLDEIERR